MHRSNGMVKACMYRSWINKIANSQLPNEPQALKIGMGDQIKDQCTGDGNKSIDRIVDNFVFVQAVRICLPLTSHGLYKIYICLLAGKRVTGMGRKNYIHNC